MAPYEQVEIPAVIFAHHQTAGRGRFGRTWASARGDSLTMSLIFLDYANHPKPWLVGMAVACAAAATLHVQLQWPNDLVLAGKKVGGILTDVIADSHGLARTHTLAGSPSPRLTDSPALPLVPVVGLGVNLNQEAFPAELSDRATSMKLVHGIAFDPKTVAQRILARLATLPEPDSWASLAPVWDLFDATPGKRYTLPDGRPAIALGIGRDGELLATVDGEPVTVLAADAWFGGEPAMAGGVLGQKGS